MGLECILFSFAVGILPLIYGAKIAIGGRVYLTSMEKEPIRGTKARVVGCLTVLFGVAYYAVIVWAWSYYDR